MDSASVRQMIAALAAEEEALDEIVKKADLRRAQIQAARHALTVLETDEPIEFEGKLSDACRAVLKKSAKALTPIEVRDELKVIGYDINKHTNIMASVHSVLKRFVDSGEAEAGSAKDGTRYRSKARVPAERQAATLANMMDPIASAAFGKTVMDSLRAIDVSNINSEYGKVAEFIRATDVANVASVADILKSLDLQGLDLMNLNLDVLKKL